MVGPGSLRGSHASPCVTPSERLQRSWSRQVSMSRAAPRRTSTRTLRVTVRKIKNSAMRSISREVPLHRPNRRDSMGIVLAP